IVAHPHHGAAKLALEPYRTPLRRPVMRIPNFMAGLHCSCEALHIEISTDKQRLVQPPQPAASHINDGEVFAYLGETVSPIISRRIESHLVALRRQRASKRNTLPLTT